MTVPVGLEPTAFRLTVERSKPTELWDQKSKVCIRLGISVFPELSDVFPSVSAHNILTHMRYLGGTKYVHPSTIQLRSLDELSDHNSYYL